MILRVLAVLLVFAVAPAGLAYEPAEVLDDPQLEERARALSAEVRCMVCQNQSIDESSAPLAKDLRILVRERLVAGDTDEQVLDYLVARYGEFVLLRPRVAPNTYALWFGPFAVLLLAAGLAFRYLTRGRPHGVAEGGAALSDDERAQVSRLLSEAGPEK